MCLAPPVAFLPLPATQEWGEGRGQGKAFGGPPLPSPLLPPREEREFGGSLSRNTTRKCFIIR